MKKIIIAALVLLGLYVTSTAQVSVVVNKSVSEDAITATEAANIFSLSISKWKDGSKIVVFNQTGKAKEHFFSGIGKSELALKKEWMKKQLTGKAKAPESLSSDSEVISKVASTPGAIGFVMNSSVTGDVKVIFEIK
jgi:ABC-type phosphate transport system substrate-binding protein